MEISLGEAITMTARNKPDAPSLVFAGGSAHTFAQTHARVYPIEIESVLADHPAIAQSAVVPVHRHAAGQRQWQDTQARAAEQGLRQEAP